MITFRYVIACTLLTLMGTFATAQCVVRGNRVFTSTYNQVAAVVPTVVPVTTQVAAYGAHYDASALEIPKIKEQLAAQEARIKQLEATRDVHLARLAILEAKLGVAPAPPIAEPKKPEDGQVKATPDDLPTVVSRSCVQCHQEGRNPKGNFILVDASGKHLTSLTCEQRLDVLRRINLEETDPDVMPPKGKGSVTDKEAAELLDRLTRIPKK